MTQALLQIENLHAFIGPYHILQGVGLKVEAGRVAALLGRNGAGKTTTLRSIMGLSRPQGRIAYDGRDIAGLTTAAIARLGIGYVPENLGIFAQLTVAENLRLAARSGSLDKARLEWLVGLFPSLERFWRAAAGNLSGGQKQMLAIAKALIEPKRLVLVDEPTKGLSPSVVAELADAFKSLVREGTSMLLVEQNFRFAAAVADEVTVIESGRTSWQGRMGEIVGSDELRRDLLGVSLV